MPESNFTTGLEGWITDNGTEIFVPTDGNPGGSLRGIEGGTDFWYFLAPAEYLGNMSSYYGGSISFDMKQDVTTDQLDGNGDIILTGAGITLAIDVGDNPGTDWTSYSVSLALGGGWKVDSLTGRIATEGEIKSVLEDLTSLQVRGEFVYGTPGDASNLDNVSMVETPAQPPEFIGASVESTFETGIDGWGFINDVEIFGWVDGGGNPGGFIEINDYATGAVWYFVAPEKFLGDKAGYSGGTLEFDLKQSDLSSQFDDEDVIISGGGLTIVHDTTDNPGLDWTHYSVNLDISGNWLIGDLGGAVASQDQIEQVLSDIDYLEIRGEFVNGDDTGGLDNVVMSPGVSAVRLLSDASIGNLLSNHETVSGALASATDGNVVLIEDTVGATLPAYDVSVNGLTFLSDAALGTLLRLDGVTSVTLAGENNMNVGGNILNNTLIGSDGNNRLNGLRGDDDLRGQDGRDILLGGHGDDVLKGGVSNDRLLGGIGNDALYGDRGVDRLFGDNGDDELHGGIGRDTLTGGAGNDFLDGGSQADKFVFEDGFGHDTIVRFGIGIANDVIDLSLVTVITDFSDLSEDHMEQVGANVVIDDLLGNTITLMNVSLSDLEADSFSF